MSHFSGLTASTTFASALSYAFQRNTYTFQHRSYDHQSAKKLTALGIFILFNLGFTYWSSYATTENHTDTNAKVCSTE